MDLENKLEALLFYKSESAGTQDLAKLFGVSAGELEEAAEKLQQNLAGRGIRLIKNNDSLMLATAPEVSELIETFRKEEFSRELSKAASETLSIVLYRGPLTRAEIDYIRGVNSTFILRNLQIRGLVEKMDNPKDQRSFLYKPTLELLSHLGITRIEDLPEFDKVKRELEAFVSEGSQATTDESTARNTDSDTRAREEDDTL